MPGSVASGRGRPGSRPGSVFPARGRPSLLRICGALLPLTPLPLMFGPLGMQEILIIMGVALIVFGPRKLPQIGKTLGKTVREFRSQSQQLRNTLEREVQMEEFRKARDEVSKVGRAVTGSLDPGRGARPGASTGPTGGAGPAAAAPRPAAPAKESAPSATGGTEAAAPAPTAGSGESGGS